MNLQGVRLGGYELLPFLHDRYGDVIHAINSTRQITPETEFKLKQGIEEFKAHFVQQ